MAVNYNNIPVTMEITAAGNLKWYAQNGSYTKTIEYKKNDGEWTQITSSNAGTMISVAVGDIVQLRGNNEQYAPQDGRCSCWSGTTASYKLYGNIMSLVNSTGFTTLSSFTQPNVFMNFFNNSKCVDAENLILPATALTDYCYQGMLAQNGNLLVGPLLPAETLVHRCYAYLFYHSNNVNNIRCLAINKSASNCLQEWVNRVQTTSGTFYKHPNMSSWNRGNSGVPNNWTIVDYALHNIETDITAITGTYETSSYTVNLSSTSEWTATTIPSWVTLSTTAGTSGDTEITVAFSKNTSYLERTGTIVFTNAESDTCEVVCTQEKYPLLIPNENIYRADLEVVKGYRSGSTINKAYRSGELIYYKLNYPEPTPPVPPSPVLPSNTFLINYNAKFYNSSTYTIQKTEGQLFNEDMVLNAAASSFTSDHITVNGQQFNYVFQSNSLNPFNRSNTDSLTVIIKAKPSSLTSGAHSLFSNRGGSYNWMVFNPANGSPAGMFFLHTSDGNYNNVPSVQARNLNEPNIFAFRVSNGTGYGHSYTDNETFSTKNISWGGITNSVHFLGGSSRSEYWDGDFYWMYISTEALTDDEIQQVIYYNENINPTNE